MQADFVLFMRREIENVDYWWPETLLYVQRFHGAFEIFARSVSKAYFDKVKKLILIDKPQDLAPLFERYKTGERKLPRWEFDTINPAGLLGYNELATKS